MTLKSELEAANTRQKFQIHFREAIVGIGFQTLSEGAIGFFSAFDRYMSQRDQLVRLNLGQASRYFHEALRFEESSRRLIDQFSLACLILSVTRHRT